MKRLYTLLAGVIGIIIALLIGLCVLNQSDATSGDTLTIYNWGDYIDPKLIAEFENQTGYHVNYETFDSNEAMFTKIKQGGTHYDIVIPSDYMIQKMKREHLLVPLDKSKIHGLSNIDPQFLNQPFDPHNQYSIPYFWGTLGIVYNPQKLKGIPMQHWKDLWNPKLKDQILLIDGAREVMGLALNRLGYSVNTEDKAQLHQAYRALCQLKPNVKAIVADEMKTYMANGEADIAVTFSGEANDMMEKNPQLRYVVPEEGSNLWFDNIVIPKTVTNKEAAYAFINFMLEPKHAAQNAEYIGYATPNWKAKQLLPKEMRENKAMYPNKSSMKHLEVYKDLGSYWLGVYNDYFLDFKMQH